MSKKGKVCELCARSPTDAHPSTQTRTHARTFAQVFELGALIHSGRDGQNVYEGARALRCARVPSARAGWCAATNEHVAVKVGKLEVVLK